MTTEIEQTRFPGAPAPAGSEATRIEQTRAAAEVIAAVQAARAVPRDERASFRAMQDACSNLDLAARAFYAYNMGGDDGNVNGATVTLARELARVWGNIDYGTQELSRDPVLKQSEVRAFCRDWETNAYASRTVIVPWIRYVGKSRKPVVEMRAIDQNNNSVAGRALREMIFSILPEALIAEAKRLCEQTNAAGDGTPLPERIRSAVEYFGKARPPITQAMLEDYLGLKRAEWKGNAVARLGVLRDSLTQGDITRAEAFGDDSRDITSADIRRQAGAEVLDPPADSDPALADDPTARDDWKGGAGT